MSAIIDDGDEVIKVLIVLHNNFDLLDFAGPLEVLSHAKLNLSDDSSDAFDVTIASATSESKVFSRQGAAIETHIDIKEAYERLEEFDVLIIPGGGTKELLPKDLHNTEAPEPVPIIKAFAELQKNDTKRERTLLSVCTGSLFLGKAGILQGLYATTHPDYDVELEQICQFASAYDTENRTEVIQGCRYVVNNARFDIDDPEDEESPANPFIQSHEEFILSKKERRKSNARRGSVSHKLAMLPENADARRTKRLGGLRVITAGGVSSGIDAALYLVSAYASIEAADEVVRIMQYFNWEKGVVVDSIDF